MGAVRFKFSGVRWWSALGLVAFLIGIVWFILATRHFNRWRYSDRYRAAELEVTRFSPKADRQGRLIHGVIHPGGEQVFTSDHEIAIGHFVDPGDRTGRRVPLPAEIEGQRVAVWYWPEHAEVQRWWHPPTVVNPVAIHGGRVVGDVLLGIAFVAAAVCFGRADSRPTFLGCA